ncbi:MAG TPA: RES family NAD+ phosphorylase [Longimicrobium sp.]|nr:RES family NAD+ phosphorylase [Longimicrobium sp.]
MYPPLKLFERVAEPEDLEEVLAIEALTDDSVRLLAGRLERIPPEDRLTGPGAGWVMGAFMHPSPSRFNDDAVGAYYTAKDRETAIRETVYHKEQFLAATSESPLDISMRMLVAQLNGVFHDIRGDGSRWPDLYHATSYTASQAFAQELRGRRSAGITYDSVRHSGGECAAVFMPRAVSNCTPRNSSPIPGTGAESPQFARRAVVLRPPRPTITG